METFSWSQESNSQGGESSRLLSAKFGDGYEQTAADGVNNAVQSWPLEFINKEPDAAQIVAFFRRHRGYKAFLWTPPLANPGYFKVASFQVTEMGAGIYTITATFEQTFKP